MVLQRTESPDGSRRAAFVGGLHRTARAVPLLCGTGAVHGTPMAMECSDLSELWISLGLRASRTTGGTGRLAPCRFCVWYRTASAVPLLCRTGAVHGTPMAMECSDLSELWISLGLRASRTTGGTGRLAPCRFGGRRRVRLWGRSAESRIPGTTPKPVRRTNRITGRLAPCRFCIRTVPDGSRRAVFVPLMMRVRSLRGLRVAADGSREKDPGDHERDLRRDEDAEPPQHTLGEAVTVQPKAKLVRPEIAPGRHDVAADR